VQLLSNGRYHVMLTNAGGGYSRWKDLAVTRWREDGTCDAWGSFCYLRDVRPAPSGRPRLPADAVRSPDQYEAIFSEGAPSSAAATTASTPTPRSSSRPRTTSSCAACA
jgi:cyclic beta-1,2-glucan synthetase